MIVAGCSLRLLLDKSHRIGELDLLALLRSQMGRCPRNVPFDDTLAMPRKLIRFLRLTEIGRNDPTGWVW
jgi:hypothetical protein